MRHIILLVVVTTLLSCGQNDTKQKELELKEKDLALKEKDLALKEKETVDQKDTITKPETTKNTVIAIKKHPQIPKDGIYTYTLQNTEPGGTVNGLEIMVHITGDSIIAIVNETMGNYKKGDVYEKGILMKHQKSGLWIIAHNTKDKFTEDAGGCSDGPTVIYFKNKTIEYC